MRRKGRGFVGSLVPVAMALHCVSALATNGIGRSEAPTLEAERVQVEQVQRRFNRLKPLSDSELWGVRDYWATPAEVLRAGGGDCEDIAVAKYFALRDLGVPAQRLRLVYARLFDRERRTIEPHVVLWYRPDTSGDDWLVLDNRAARIQPRAQRGDLSPQVTFNELQVADWREGEGERHLGGPELVDPWYRLLQRRIPQSVLAWRDFP